MPSPEAFRQGYRQRELSPRYRGWLHLSLNVGLALVAALVMVLLVEQPSLAELLTVPAAFFVANLGEYAGHRWPMHRRMRPLVDLFKGHAGQHHRYFLHDSMEGEDLDDFHATLFDPILLLFFLGGMGVPGALALGLLVSVNTGLLFMSTALCYFAVYELLHLAYHLPVRWGLGRIPGFSILRRLHQAHHNPALMGRYNFNITWPIMDVVFGTLWRGAVDASGREVRASARAK